MPPCQWRQQTLNLREPQTGLVISRKRNHGQLQLWRSDTATQRNNKLYTTCVFLFWYHNVPLSSMKNSGCCSLVVEAQRQTKSTTDPHRLQSLVHAKLGWTYLHRPWGKALHYSYSLSCFALMHKHINGYNRSNFYLRFHVKSCALFHYVHTITDRIQAQ